MCLACTSWKEWKHKIKLKGTILTYIVDSLRIEKW